MSLPSTAIFHMNDGTNKSVSCNIGWFYEERLIPNCVRDSCNCDNIKDEEWHSVTLYERTYTKKQLNEITLRKGATL